MTTPLRTLLWNRPAVTDELDQIVHVGIRYPWRHSHDLPDAKWDWRNVQWQFTVSGLDMNPAAAARELMRQKAKHGRAALAFDNIFWWQTFAPSDERPDPARPGYRCPHRFSLDSIAHTNRIVSEIRRALVTTPMTADDVGELDLIFDLEEWGPAAKEPESAKDKPWGKSVDGVRTACYLLTTALSRCGWEQINGAIACNFACSNGIERILCGGGADRFTPAPITGAFDGHTACFAGYGETWHLTREEHMDMIAKAPAGSVLDIATRQPHRDEIIEHAAKSGKFTWLLVWDDGSTDKADDERKIAQAVGMGR